MKCYECKHVWRVKPEDLPPLKQLPNSGPNAATQPQQPGFYRDGNYAEVISTGIRDPRTIPTVESVLAEFKIDLDRWMICSDVKTLVNRWEMGYTGADKEPGHYPLYQVKVPLVLRTPEVCEWPIIEAAKVRPWAPKARKTKRPLKRAVIVPDGHFGFRRDMQTGELIPMHDRRVTDIVARVIRDHKPDLVVLLGDNLDLPDWSDKFLVTPDCRYLTQAAIDELASWLMSWRPYAGEVVYLEGNHEERMPRAITRNCEAAWNLRRANCPDDWPAMSVPHLLNLDAMDIEWIGGYPKNKSWMNENLRSRHAEKLTSKPGMVAGRSLEHARCSMFFGHAHRVETAYTTVHAYDKIRTYGSHCYGTMARLDDWGPPSAGPENNWQQGFGLVHFEPGNGIYGQEQVVVYDGRCVAMGEPYESEIEMERMTA